MSHLNGDDQYHLTRSAELKQLKWKSSNSSVMMRVIPARARTPWLVSGTFVLLKSNALSLSTGALPGRGCGRTTTAKC